MTTPMPSSSSRNRSESAQSRRVTGRLTQLDERGRSVGQLLGNLEHAEHSVEVADRGRPSLGVGRGSDRSR